MRLCSKCKEEGVHSDSGHQIVKVRVPKPGDVVHAARCCGCHTAPIIGTQFRCGKCAGYGICGECMERGVHSEHESSIMPLTCHDCEQLVDIEGYWCVTCKSYLCSNCRKKEDHSDHTINQCLGIFEGSGDFVQKIRRIYNLTNNLNKDTEKNQ